MNQECHFAITQVINVSPQQTIISDSIIPPLRLHTVKCYMTVIIFLLTVFLNTQQFLVDVGELRASRV